MNKCYKIAILGVFLALALTGNAFAGTEVDDLLRNVNTSISSMPALLTATSYLLALLFGVTGLLKLKDHVENPNQTQLRTPIIRFLIGGALLTLPIVYEAMKATIMPGAVAAYNPQGVIGGAAAGVLGLSVVLQDFNTVLDSIKDSFQDAPGIISAGTYMMGLLLGVTGLLKVKEHVENPDQTPLREGVIRLLTGGALFAIPAVYQALYQTINGAPGGGGLFGAIAAAFGAVNWFWSGYTGLGGSVCNPVGLGLGNAICGLIVHTGALPAFLTAVGYMIGLVLGVWGVLKIKAHVLNPAQTPIHEALTRLLAAGMFFALPAMISVAKATMISAAMTGLTLAPTGRYNETAVAGCAGLDGALYCFMDDLIGPVHIVLSFFAFCAGAILIMIGISRFIKSAQEGARGPLGLGTFMTFAIGGALISFNELVRAATTTLFSNPITLTNGTLAYTTGMTAAEVQQAHTVISSIIKFMILVGLVSFVRGLFIIREVAEGNHQASLMAGVTHIVGGALAVNLGPLINAVQNTLGFGGAYGINFGV